MLVVVVLVVWWCFCGAVFLRCFCGVFMVVFLWWCFCGGVLVARCFCGGVFVVVFLWWCSCGAVFLWWCFCGGGVVAFLWWCSCGGVFVVVWCSTGVVLEWCSCGGVFVMVWWCFCCDTFVSTDIDFMLLWSGIARCYYLLRVAELLLMHNLFDS